MIFLFFISTNFEVLEKFLETDQYSRKKDGKMQRDNSQKNFVFFFSFRYISRMKLSFLFPPGKRLRNANNSRKLRVGRSTFLLKHTIVEFINAVRAYSLAKNILLWEVGRLLVFVYFRSSRQFIIVCETKKFFLKKFFLKIRYKLVTLTFRRGVLHIYYVKKITTDSKKKVNKKSNNTENSSN